MSTETYTAIRTVGGLLPADLLNRVSLGLGGRVEAVKDLEGLKSDAYHLGGERVRDAANRSWTYLTGAWARFQDELAAHPDDVSASVTWKRWSLLLFAQLGYGQLERTPAGGLEGGEKSFSISHHWQHLPVHLVSWSVPIDKRTTKNQPAPTSMAQELLNRSDAHLWAIVSNGRVLRLLRDSTSLVRASYVEFDLEAIFDGDLYNEFVLLFALLHQSRFEVLAEDGGPADCWLERWRTQSVERGQRALDQLKDGVVEAIDVLGTGFVRHPANAELREQLRSGELRSEDYQRALLRVVYRLLFLFVAEDRGALLPERNLRYEKYFSSARLREAAVRRLGTRHGDRWQALQLVLSALGGPEIDERGELIGDGTAGLPELGLPGLGGIFQRGPLDRPLRDAQLANQDLLAAVRSLCVLKNTGDGPRRTVDYRNLDAEELGSVYETLLAYLPRHDPDARTFHLEVLGGNERKTTGSYYTPSSLVECLLDSALDPVLDDAMKNKATAQEQEEALLAVTVCDPACGSGHFLVAAARRIAKRLAAVRTGEVEPSADDVRHAVHDVIARCIYGVDLNDWAVELAKVSLWMESLEPGRPLSFLDAHIKVGNSLLGVTPSLLLDGVPESAFKPLEGDDKAAVAALKKLNATERDRNTMDLFGSSGVDISNKKLANQVTEITAKPARSLADVHTQALRYRQYAKSEEFLHRKEVADAWCAAFVAPKNLVPGASDAKSKAERSAIAGPWPLTYQTIMNLEADPGGVDPCTRALVKELTEDYRFFHWHLEFPEIFPVGDGEPDPVTGWSGGFSCVLGNPPWERVKLQEQEFFAARSEAIAKAPSAASRRKLIAALKTSLSAADRAMSDEFEAAKRVAEGVSHLLRDSNRFPLTGRGDVNTYAVFAETAQTIAGPAGRTGVIVPSGIATDSTTQHFFRALVDGRRLVSLFDFETNPSLWSGIGHNRFKFCLLTSVGRRVEMHEVDFSFFGHSVADLERPSARFRLTPDEIAQLNPVTGTCPVFRSRRDAEIVLDIYCKLDILSSNATWGAHFSTMFHMSNHSHLFHARDVLEASGWRLRGNVFVKDSSTMLPLIEAKMVGYYDNRAADVTVNSELSSRQGQPAAVSSTEHGFPDRSPIPRCWVESSELGEAGYDPLGAWLIVVRDLTHSANERTVITSPVPSVAIANTLSLLNVNKSGWHRAALLANLSSFVLDYVARQKVGGIHLNFFILDQLPIVSPLVLEDVSPWDVQVNCIEWMLGRVLELSFTSWDMESFARDVGDVAAPFVWDEDRRALLRAELDGAFFHLYRVKRDDVDYIMETFPIVKRKDNSVLDGEYRTKQLILDVYDRMQKAIDSGEPYQTLLDPPPGQGLRHAER